MTLHGKRVLIVEDEYYIASDLKRALVHVGAVVLGPFNAVGLALPVAVNDTVDAALIDVNLEGTTSFSVADALATRGIPFLFLTGYDRTMLPDEYRATPRMAKPFNMEVVLDTLTGLLCPEVAL